jgi:hypothetical protein
MEQNEQQQRTDETPASAGRAKNGTRRRGFGAGLRLAAAGTAALAALPLGAAAASNGHDDDDDRRLRGLERAIEAREEALRRFRERLENRRDAITGQTSLGRRLVRVNDVNGDDFDRGSDPQNRDPLSSGSVVLLRESNNDARVQVFLDNATANAVYEVIFMGIRDNRITVGYVRTDGNGDFADTARKNSDFTGDEGRLGGGNRVGVFVLRRNNLDQFVTALASRS